MLPLWLRFFTITVEPLWVAKPIQRLLTVCPLANVQVRVQLESAVDRRSQRFSTESWRRAQEGVGSPRPAKAFTLIRK